jgi:hypothetical protein
MTSGRPTEIPRPRDSEDAPVLLLRRNPRTGNWAFKRTRRPWIGGFPTRTAAICEAERLGLPQPYVIAYALTEEA